MSARIIEELGYINNGQLKLKPGQIGEITYLPTGQKDYVVQIRNNDCYWLLGSAYNDYYSRSFAGFEGEYSYRILPKGTKVEITTEV